MLTNESSTNGIIIMPPLRHKSHTDSSAVAAVAGAAVACAGINERIESSIIIRSFNIQGAKIVKGERRSK